MPALAAVATAVLFELAGSAPGWYPCAILAPLPILAVAPEIRTERAAQFAFVAYFFGNLVAWGGESFAVPLITMFASHVAGAIVFATFVACAAEATRRWSGVLAALVFPTSKPPFILRSPDNLRTAPGQPRLLASWIRPVDAVRVMVGHGRRDVHHVAVAVGIGGRVVSASMEHGVDSSRRNGGRRFRHRGGAGMDSYHSNSGYSGGAGGDGRQRSPDTAIRVN